MPPLDGVPAQFCAEAGGPRRDRLKTVPFHHLAGQAGGQLGVHFARLTRGMWARCGPTQGLEQLLGELLWTPDAAEPKRAKLCSVLGFDTRR